MQAYVAFGSFMSVERDLTGVGQTFVKGQILLRYIGECLAENRNLMLYLEANLGVLVERLAPCLVGIGSA